MISARPGVIRPLTDLIPVERLPDGLAEMVNRTSRVIGYTHVQKTLSVDGPVFSASIALRGGGVLECPGIRDFALIVGEQAAGWMLIPIEFRVAEPKLSIRDVPLKLRIPASILQPAKLVPGAAGKPPKVVPDKDTKPLEIALGALSVEVSPEGGIDYDFDVEIDLPLCTIGNTGFGVEVTGARFYGREDEPPSGRPSGWRGLYVREATVYLPEFLARIIPKLSATDCTIGNGGFSGRVSGLWNAQRSGNAFTGPGSGDLFGIPFALDRVDVKLRQSTFETCSIAGRMILPFFDEVVEVDISIEDGGRIHVALDAQNGLKTITKPNVMTLTLESIVFEIANGSLVTKLAGKLTPLYGAPALKWPAFDIDEFSIDSKGNVSCRGGWVDLPQGYTLDLKGFKFEITKFGAGRDERGDQYFGFNGGLHLVKGIPAGASVEGLRITMRESGAALSFRGVGIEVDVKDKLHFKGEVHYDDGAGEFAGEMKLELPALRGLKLDGKVVFGTQPAKYFALYVDGEFDKGFPIGTSGLDLTGVAGLFTVNYMPKKPDDWAWTSMDKSKSWVHQAPLGVTSFTKWTTKDKTMALAAGVSIATHADNGFTFNGKFLLMMLLPGGVILIDGRGSFLERRSAQKDSTDPPFHAMAVLDAKAGTFLIGLDARFKYDRASGKLVEISGSAEALFNWNDPSSWRIAIGEEELSRRIRAVFAGGLQANAYFILDARRLRLGVWVGKQDRYKLGPLRIALEAWFDANAVLSFRPPQVSTGVHLHGLLGVEFLKWGFTFILDATLQADVAKPFHIAGSVAVRIETRFKDFELELSFEIGPRVERPTDIPQPFRGSAVARLESMVEWPLLADGNPRVPPDARPYITFEQPVHDATTIAVNPAPDPGWITIGDPDGKTGSAQVRYVLTKVALQIPDGKEWRDAPGKLYGAWAAGPPNPGGGGSLNRFMIGAKHAFEVTNDSDAWNAWAAGNLPDYPCPVVPDERICIDWEATTSRSEVSSPWNDPRQFSIEWSGGTRTVIGMRGGVDGYNWGILFPAPRPRSTAYVANASAGTVSVIDAEAGTVTATIRVGKTPSAIALTPDGRTLVVTNGDDRTISIIDTETNTVIGSPILIQGYPTGVVVSPNGLKAYVVSRTHPFLYVIHLKAQKLVRTIPLPSSAETIALLPNGSKAYLALKPSTLAVFNPVTESLVGVPTPSLMNMWCLVASPDSTRLYIAGDLDRIGVVDTSKNAMVGLQTKVGNAIFELAITPDGTRLYVPRPDANVVAVIDAATRQTVATIAVGSHPIGVAISADGSRAYVTNSFANTLSIIDTATNAVVGNALPVGNTPREIVISAPRTEPADVWIDVPDGSAVVEILLYQAKGRITGEVYEPMSKLPPAVSADGRLSEGITLRFDAKEFGFDEGIRRIRIRSDQDWILIRVCVVRPALEHGLKDVIQLQQRLDDALSVWGEPTAVLQPNTDYQIVATVERSIVGMGKLSGWSEKQTFSFARRFHTDGPPGIGVFDRPAGVDAAKGAIGFDDLTPYVAQTIPPVLPPPGKLPALQRPVFRADDAGCMFNQDYVDRMYELAGRDLTVQLRNARNEPVRDVDGNLIVSANRWGKAAESKITEARRRAIDTLNAAPCLTRDIDVAKLPPNKQLTTSDHVLDSDALHEARLVPLLLRAPIAAAGGVWRPAMLGPVSMIEVKDGSEWTGMLIQVSVRPVAGGRCGVVFRSSAAGRYLLVVDAAASRCMLTGIARQALERPFAYDATKRYQLAIEAIGDRLRITQDGELLFDVRDATWAKGTVGLFPSGAPFQELSVHDFRKTPAIAFAFAFTTSKYVDFFHQLHSFQDETWTATPRAGFDVAAAIVRASDLKTAAQEKESRAYAAVADALLGAAANSLPPRVEVTRVVESNAVKAIWVRGAEPIDWSRTTLSVRTAGLNLANQPSPGAAKLTDALYATSGQTDTVIVLLRDAFDASSYRIDIRNAAGAWMTWYSFGKDRLRAAGTRFEIRAGAVAASLAPPAPGVVRKFASAAGEGTAFPATGVELQLVAPEGRVEHARRFVPAGAFAPVAFDVMRSADGTGFFLLPTTGSDWKSGTYRLELKYERNVLGAVRSRGGRVEAVTAAIDVAGAEVAEGPAAFIQSRYGTRGNFEVIAASANGGLVHYSRNNDAGGHPWQPLARFAVASGGIDAVSLIHSSFGNLEIIVRIGDRLAHFWRSGSVWQGPFFLASGVAGTPSLIQSRGTPGFFEVVTPLASGGMSHIRRNNQTMAWSTPVPFAAPAGIVSDVSLIQSNYGDNLEVVARIGDRLAHFWRSGSWQGPFFVASGVAGTPSFIQGRFGTRGHFEIVTPLASGGLGHFTRNNDTGAWSGPVRFGSGTARSAALIHSNFGNLEVVARIGRALVHYWRTSAPPWTWNGPFTIEG